MGSSVVYHCKMTVINNNMLHSFEELGGCWKFPAQRNDKWDDGCANYLDLISVNVTMFFININTSKILKLIMYKR